MADSNDVIATMVDSLVQGQGGAPAQDPDAMQQQIAAMQNAQAAPMPQPDPVSQNHTAQSPDMGALSSLMSRSGPPPMVEGGSPARNPNQPPTMSGRKPNIVNLIQGLMNPAKGTPAGERTPSRTDVFENFLGQFMNSFSQGMAASGHGPGANLRGAAAAIGAPYKQDVQEFQQQQQQRQQEASLAQQAAQTQQTQVGTQGAQLNQEMIRRRLAMMGGTDAQNVIGNLGKLSEDEQAVIQSGRLESNMKGDMAPLMAAVKQVTQNRAVSGREGAGTVVENADSPTGYSKVFYDKTGKNILRKEDNIPPPQGTVPKTTRTQRLIKDKDGNIVAVPITTESGPSIPVKKKGQSGGGGGSGIPNAGGGGRAQIRGTSVLGPDGEPLHGDMSQSAKTTIGQISAALHLSDRIQPDIESAVSDMKRGGNLMDAAKVRSAWAQYLKLGIDPSNVDPDSIVSKLPGVDPRIARILPTIAMLQIVGAQPYLKNIRRFEFIKQVQQHIPDPEKDTPQLMLSKLQQLNRNLPLILAATYKGEGVTPKMDREMGERYMHLAGDDHNKARLMARQDGWKF